MSVLGRTVFYTMTEFDAEGLEVARSKPDSKRIGSRAQAGDYYPAIITRLSSDGSANLQIILDGNDGMWVTDAYESHDLAGVEFGTWSQFS